MPKIRCPVTFQQRLWPVAHQVQYLVIHAHLRLFQTWGADIFSGLDVGSCIFKENVPIETFNVLFESIQNTQQYGATITCTEVRGGNLWLL